jgi:hypothetical protein
VRRTIRVGAIVLLAGLVAAAAWAATHRDELRAWRQAAVIGASLDADRSGGDSRIVGVLGSETTPIVRATAGELPATLTEPVGVERDAPVIALVVPDGTSRIEERDIADAQRALAAAGFRAWAIRVPAMGQLLTSDAAGDQLVAAIAAIDESESGAGGDSGVAVVAVGPAASIVLHEVATGALRGRVPAVVAVLPVADVRSLLRRALTDPEIDEELRVDAGRAITLASARLVDDRSTIATQLLDAAARSDDPIRSLRAIPRRFAPRALDPVFALLDSTTPGEFDEAWAALPVRLRTLVERHAPLPVAAEVEARVLLVDDPAQRAAVRDGVAQLEGELPDSRVVQVPGSIEQADVRELLGVSAWWLQRAGA